MNQPLGSCHSYTHELTTMGDDLKRYLSHKQASSPEAISQQEDNSNAMDVDHPIMEDYEGYEGSVVEERSEFFVEEFDSASETYGRGSTFMDDFDCDNHASERIDNIYYPFTSRNEWELASFLLQSDLSMASINKFLSLALVSSDFKYHHSSILSRYL